MSSAAALAHDETANDAVRPRHVLVVEDEFTIRTMLTDALGDAGYTVFTAADGAEALRHLRSARPDLIVLDMMMPGVSGWQFLEQSRPLLERMNIPVVILSAIEGKGDYPLRSAWPRGSPSQSTSTSSSTQSSPWSARPEPLPGRPRYKPGRSTPAS